MANGGLSTPAALRLFLLLPLLLQIANLSDAFSGGIFGTSYTFQRRQYGEGGPGRMPTYKDQSPDTSFRRANEVYPDKSSYPTNEYKTKKRFLSSERSEFRALLQPNEKPYNGVNGELARQNAERSRQTSAPLDRPTLRPAGNFNAREDAAKLREALNKQVDENTIIKIMTKRTDEQRQEIMRNYPNLKKDLGWKLSFGFRELMKALATPLPDFQAEQLKEAFRFSTRIDEDLIIEMLCTLNNRQIRRIREAYKRLNRRDIDEELGGFSLNPFAKFLISYTQGNRDERNVVDLPLATYDAQQLQNVGKLSLNNNTPFRKILISRSFPQLRLTFSEYKRISGRGIKDAIRKDFTGNIQKGLLNIVRTINNRANYFAEILNGGIKTFSKRDATLIRVIVLRAEIDMEDIKSSYHHLYNLPLSSSIPTNTGTMKKALLSLISS